MFCCSDFSVSSGVLEAPKRLSDVKMVNREEDVYVLAYLHHELCLLLRSSWIQLNSGLPRSALVTSVSLSRGVMMVGSMFETVVRV